MDYRNFKAFARRFPGRAVHRNPPRPPCADPVWVSVWVKNVAPEWVSHNGGFPRRIQTSTTSKTTLCSGFQDLRWADLKEVFHSRFSSHLPKQQLLFPLPVISQFNANMGQRYGSGRSATPERNPYPTPRCRDCTIEFRNCKSFFRKENYRQAALGDTIWRYPIKQSYQLIFFSHRIFGLE